MILQITADSWAVQSYFDPAFREPFRRPHARPLQDDRRAYCAGAQDNFSTCPHLERFAIAAAEADSGGTRSVE
jgi:hypothetical protein